MSFVVFLSDDVDSGFADSRESSSSGYLRSRESASSSGSGFLRNRAPEAGSSFRREPGADDWVGEETVTSRASRVSDIVTRVRSCVCLCVRTRTYLVC